MVMFLAPAEMAVGSPLLPAFVAELVAAPRELKQKTHQREEEQ
jgi:hypothetical protein